VEADALWKPNGRLPQGLGKRSAFPTAPTGHCYWSIIRARPGGQFYCRNGVSSSCRPTVVSVPLFRGGVAPRLGRGVARPHSAARWASFRFGGWDPTQPRSGGGSRAAPVSVALPPRGPMEARRSRPVVATPQPPYPRSLLLSPFSVSLCLCGCRTTAKLTPLRQ
jgi:hypothetical protein